MYASIIGYPLYLNTTPLKDVLQTGGETNKCRRIDTVMEIKTE